MSNDELNRKLIGAVEEQADLDTVREMVEAGADVNSVTGFRKKYSVLYQAAQNGMSSVIEFLLSKGANIELGEDVASGIYSNLAIITYSNSEFILDFVQVMPGIPKARVKSRVILTPQHAKRLMKAMKEHIARFESANGQITDTEFSQAFPMPFGGPKGMA